MKKTGTQTLADKLLSLIFTTVTLKDVSISLEEIAQNKHLKNHASKIVNDASLTTTQKKRQLNYLIGSIENPVVHDFLLDEIGDDEIWLFDNEKIDYLDEFVQTFQLTTETTKVLHLTTAIALSGSQLTTISRDLTHEFGYKVILEHQVNPNLIGGIQVKIENYVFDFSLRSKFQQFQREWLSSLDKTTKLVGHYDLDV